MIDSSTPTADLEWFTCTSPGGQYVLMITGTASLTVYEELLRAIQYEITALEPDKTVPLRHLEVGISQYWLSAYIPN